jgi:hypothetical protein
MRRTMHSNSVARPRRPKPRVGLRRSRKNSNGGSGWRVRGSPHPSERSVVCKTDMKLRLQFNRELVALGSLRGRTARRQRDVHWSMDSSRELLRSLDPASGSVHCCEVPCRTLRSIRGDLVLNPTEIPEF